MLRDSGYNGWIMVEEESPQAEVDPDCGYPPEWGISAEILCSRSFRMERPHGIILADAGAEAEKI